MRGRGRGAGVLELHRVESSKAGIGQGGEYVAVDVHTAEDQGRHGRPAQVSLDHAVGKAREPVPGDMDVARISWAVEEGSPVSSPSNWSR